MEGIWLFAAKSLSYCTSKVILLNLPSFLHTSKSLNCVTLAPRVYSSLTPY